MFGRKCHCSDELQFLEGANDIGPVVLLILQPSRAPQCRHAADAALNDFCPLSPAESPAVPERT
jgi:hypothetical protein